MKDYSTMNKSEIIENLRSIAEMKKSLDDKNFEIFTLEFKYRDENRNYIRKIKAHSKEINPQVLNMRNQINKESKNQADLMRRMAITNSKDEFLSLRDKFRTSCIEYDKEFPELVLNYAKAQEEGLDIKKGKIDEVNAERKAILAEIEDKKAKINDEIEILKATMKENSVIHEKYYYLSNEIADILEEGRAWTLTDALNLAIQDNREIEYNKEQLRIKEEEKDERNRILEEQYAEEQFNREEMRRIAEKQAEEERRHNMQMEYMEREQQRKAEQEKYYLEMQHKESEAKARKEQDRMTKAISLCSRCKRTVGCIWKNSPGAGCVYFEQA